MIERYNLMKKNENLDKQKFVDEINWHNKCARLTLGNLPEVKVENIFPKSKHTDPPITDAVNFAEWLLKNDWYHSSDGKKWNKTLAYKQSVPSEIYDKTYVKTTTELYELFLNEILKTPNGKFGEFYKKPLIPLDAHDFEVFAVIDTNDSPTGKQAFIGFKNKNNDFHYISVPYTVPKRNIDVEEEMKKQIQRENICANCKYFLTQKETDKTGFCAYSDVVDSKRFIVNKKDSCQSFDQKQHE